MISILAGAILWLRALIEQDIEGPRAPLHAARPVFAPCFAAAVPTTAFLPNPLPSNATQVG
jgi:hypothetical protein